MVIKKKNRPSSIVHRRCRGFTLIEALMASALLAACAAGVLLPISAAAAAQADAQRRVVATRFAADVVETLIAGQTLNETVTPADLGYSAAAYAGMVCHVTVNDNVGIAGLTLVTVAVGHNGRPVATLKTLVGS